MINYLHATGGIAAHYTGAAAGVCWASVAICPGDIYLDVNGNFLGLDNVDVTSVVTRQVNGGPNLTISGFYDWSQVDENGKGSIVNSATANVYAQVLETLDVVNDWGFGLGGLGLGIASAAYDRLNKIGSEGEYARYLIANRNNPSVQALFPEGRVRSSWAAKLRNADLVRKRNTLAKLGKVGKGLGAIGFGLSAVYNSYHIANGTAKPSNYIDMTVSTFGIVGTIVFTANPLGLGIVAGAAALWLVVDLAGGDNLIDAHFSR